MVCRRNAAVAEDDRGVVACSNTLARRDAAKVHSGTYAGSLSAFGGTNSLLIVYNERSVAGQPEGALCRVRLFAKTDSLQFAVPGKGLRVITAVWDTAGQVVTYNYQNGDFAGTHNYTPVHRFVSSCLPPLPQATVCPTSLSGEAA